MVIESGILKNIYIYISRDVVFTEEDEKLKKKTTSQQIIDLETDEPLKEQENKNRPEYQNENQNNEEDNESENEESNVDTDNDETEIQSEVRENERRYDLRSRRNKSMHPKYQDYVTESDKVMLTCSECMDDKNK
jgi:hypothetical protein